MISESHIYKDELLRYAADFVRRKTQKRWVPRSILLMERQLFFGFFLIRKLCETPTVSDSLRSCSYPVILYPIEAPFEINWTTEHKVVDHIDFERPKTASLTIAKICNQFIHSFVLYFVQSESGGLEEVIVSSDWFKEKQCFALSVDTVTRIFNEFGSNYAHSIKWHRQPGTLKLISYKVE